MRCSGGSGRLPGISTPSDALMRFGAPGAAAQMLQGGINHDPTNIALWTQLGVVIATRDKTVSPAALFAFRRAIALSPAEPAPWFFLGLAQVRSGEFVAARTAWARALALTPADYPTRGAIALRLALLDRLLAQGGGGPRHGSKSRDVGRMGCASAGRSWAVSKLASLILCGPDTIRPGSVAGGEGRRFRAYVVDSESGGA